MFQEMKIRIGFQHVVDPAPSRTSTGYSATFLEDWFVVCCLDPKVSWLLA